MTLHPWSHATSAALTLRGWHSEPSGKPVLHFLHGNGFSTRSYEPMLALLAADFDLWLVDTQGHGASDQGGEFLGWRENALLALEASASARRIFGDTVPLYAVGHSYGGVLTGYLMATQPQLFRRAVLLDPVLFTPALLVAMRLAYWWKGTPANDMAARALKRRHTWPDREAAHYDLYDRGIFKGWAEEALLAHITHALKAVEGGVALCCPPAQEAAIFSRCPRGLWRALRAVRTPTHVIHGDTSYPFVTRSASRWPRANRFVSAEQVRGGHCFMQQFPADTAQRVARFLLD